MSNSDKPANVVKMLAEEQVSSVMAKMDISDTPENREDILALALNDLPSKYVNTSGGKIYTQLVENYRPQYETDVLRCLTKAAMKVKVHPRQTKP